MGINLLALTPHKVSKDLSGYITYIYGAPKTGKTTLATQMDGALLLAFEPGYNALPGVMAQDITTWSEMKQVYRELKNPEVQKIYKAVIVDTIDIAADRCKKYVCQQNDVEDLAEMDYGKGWSKFKDEFNEVFRGLTQLGYAVFFIGHDKVQLVKDKVTKEEVLSIKPAISNSIKTVIAGMADIFGYAHEVRVDEMSVLTLRDPSGTIECGTRFKYIPNEITMSYDNLVSALHEAIDKEAKEHDNQFVTEERNPVMFKEKTYDFDGMMKEFQETVSSILTKNQSYSNKITEIVEKYLGKGSKVGNCTATQSEQLELILIDLRDLKAACK